MSSGAPVRWDTDNRPATLYTRAYVRGMWLNRDKQAFEGEQHTLDVAEEKQRGGDASPTRLTRLTSDVTERDVAGITVWTVRPRRRPPVSRVFYVHGGGYVHPLTPDYWRLVRSFTRAGIEVVLPAYPLAPRNTVDDVLPRLLDVLAHTRAEQPALPTLLMGDSAGGALVLVMAMRLRDLGEQPTARVVALSPWLDAKLDDERVGDLEASDPMLAESGLRAAGRSWAGVRSPSDPLISPVQGSLAGIPPLDVFIGSHDILRPAVDALADRAGREGAVLHVHETPAMFHVWMTRAIPEGRRTRRQLARLVTSQD